MDRLKGLVGAAGTMVEKSGWADKITQLKENYLNKVYVYFCYYTVITFFFLKTSYFQTRYLFIVLILKYFFL